jgi:nitrous oxide reductase accessory protein NosL
MNYKNILVGLMALGLMISFSQAEMKCAPGKCGAAMKSSKPKKMMKKMFQTVPKDQATLVQKGDAKAFCPECGMTLSMFFKTNHIATANSDAKQYCSIHCLVEDMQKGTKLTDIKVVDTKTLKIIDALHATYVVGSNKKGTMSMVSKYAFANVADAEAFAKANGGTVTDFNGAIEAAKNDFNKDSKMIENKQAMMAKKGKMIYNKMCQPTKIQFGTTAEAKAYVTSHNVCKNLNGKQLQAVGLYLKNR